MLGEAGTERPFDGQLCHEYVYQKLLKLDNPSSDYGKKIGVFMPHSVQFVWLWQNYYNQSLLCFLELSVVLYIICDMMHKFSICSKLPKGYSVLICQSNASA